MSQRTKMKILSGIVAAVTTCQFGITNAQSPEFQGPRFEGPRRLDGPSNHSPNTSFPPERNASPGAFSKSSSGYGHRPDPPQNTAAREGKTTEWTIFLQHRFHQRVEIDTECKLSELPGLIQEEFSIPCSLDQAAMRIAKVDPSSVIVPLHAAEIPASVALKQALAPLNLTAKLTSDGLVITADFSKLARAGIATDRWVGISSEVAEQMKSDLNQTVSIAADRTPLEEAIASLQEHLLHSIEIDILGLEQMGLSADVPVKIHAKETSFLLTMNRMLRGLDLTLQFENDVWVVTTIEAAEDRPLNRIYYLEATGLTESILEAIELVQISVDPETWEVLGGVGTMAALPSGGSNRPGILISTTFATHLKIDALFDALRAGTVGDDVPTKSVPFQDPMTSGSFHPHGHYFPASDPSSMGQGNSSGTSQNAPNNPTPNTPQQTGGMF